uniref:RING-type E3 ubiquitin transferase n=1 Tax=Panagrolaimus sp. JU765 TaxID=591449 RepID=A0AC34PUX3_9BILA
MTTAESTNNGGNKINLNITRFDKIRSPHPVFEADLPDPGTGIVLERFRPELTCKICGNVLNQPVISRMCMHRFCKNCVVKNGTQLIATECPECGVKFAQDRSFLIDHNFSEIVCKLVPKECDPQRRNMLVALRATGIDVDGFYEKHNKEPNYASSDDWTNVPLNRESRLLNAKLDHQDNGIKNPARSPPMGCNRSTVWRTKFSCNDVIHIETENGALQLTIEQLDLLPFILNPESIQTAPAVLPCTYHQLYSLCNDSKPTHIAELESVYVPMKVTIDTKNLLVSLPTFILKLFPREFYAAIVREREQIPDLPLITHRQRIKQGMLLALIMFPDSSVLKSKYVPKCLKRPRYIYSPPYATVGHLAEYLVLRANIESHPQPISLKVELAEVLDERKEVSLRISSEVDSAIADETQPKGEFLLKVKCGASACADRIFGKNDTLIVLKHPFKALDKHVKVKSLATNYRVLGRPLKIVFRVISPIK